MRIRVTTALVAAGVLAWVGVAAQPTQPRPGPGSGVVTVEGSVIVANIPTVQAMQLGDWKVTVANAPDVRVANAPTVHVAGPAFLKVEGRYELVWSTGDRETVVVRQLGQGGWIRVDGATGRERWVNLTTARSVAAVP